MLFFRLGAAPLYILDEVKNAQCAREMLQRSDAVVPTFNGELRTDKPVLHYQFMMASYSLFGFSPFAARFFSALFGLACLFTVYGFTKRLMDERTAKSVAWVLVLSTHWTFEFRLAVPDPYLIFFSTLGLMSGFVWLEGYGRRHLWVASGSLALAVLAKGPVAIAIPGLCLAAWALLRGSWKSVRLSDIATACLLFLVISLPWYAEVHRATEGAWTKGLFMSHNIGLFTRPREGHEGLFALPVLFLAVGLLPLSSMTCVAYRMRNSVFTDPFVRFSLLVTLVHLLVFGLSATKLPNYVMPAYPFTAVILGKGASLYFERTGAYLPRSAERMLLGILWLLPVAGLFALTSEPGLQDVRLVPLWLFAAPLLASILLLARRRAIRMPHLFPLAAGWLAFNSIGLHHAFPVVYHRNPVAGMSDLVGSAPAVSSYGIYNPAFNIVLDAPLRRYDNMDSITAWLDRNPGGLVVSRKKAADSLRSAGLHVIAEQRDLFEKPTTVILRR